MLESAKGDDVMRGKNIQKTINLQNQSGKLQFVQMLNLRAISICSSLHKMHISFFLISKGQHFLFIFLQRLTIAYSNQQFYV